MTILSKSDWMQARGAPLASFQSDLRGTVVFRSSSMGDQTLDILRIWKDDNVWIYSACQLHRDWRGNYLEWPKHDPHHPREVLGNWKHYNISAETLNYRNQRARSPLMTRELNRSGEGRGSWHRSRLLSFHQKLDCWILHLFFSKRKPHI